MDDDHADHHAHPLKRIMEPGPRPPSGPENSLPSPRHIFASDYSTTSALTHRRSPSLPFPRSTRAASSSSSTANATAVTEADRRRSNASAESMDSSQGNTYMSDRSPSSGPTMRPNLPSTTLGDATVKLTPITGRVSRAKKGIPVHVCDLCHPPKVSMDWKPVSMMGEAQVLIIICVIELYASGAFEVSGCQDSVSD